MISFFNEDIKFDLKNKRAIKSWINQVALLEDKSILNVNYIFCSDNYLLGLNIEYLDHNYLTDILTFPSSDEENNLEGDVFISIDRVRDNAKLYNLSFDIELYRVLVHGLLHLCGYNDLSTEEKKTMTSKEDIYLKILPTNQPVSRGTTNISNN